MIRWTDQIHELPPASDIGGGRGLYGRQCDGPLWLPDLGVFAFSDAGHDRRVAWSAADGYVLLHSRTGRALGAAVDPAGRIVSCEWATRRVTRLEADDSTTVLADAAGGGALSGPDDVVVATDGTVFFTDVAQSRPPGAVEGAGSAVYRVQPGSFEPALVTDAIALPGGLALAPQEDRLFVVDSQTSTVHVLDLGVDRPIPRPWAQVPPGGVVPQGMTVDPRGRLYVGGPGGIWVFGPDGTAFALIEHPASSTTNICLGGESGSTLFFTTYVAAGYVELPEGWLAPRARSTVSAPRRPALSRLPDAERRIVRLRPELDELIAPDAEVEVLASAGVRRDLGGGPHPRFARSLEGLIWDARLGVLFFSDIGNNRRMRWKDGALDVAHHPTGHTNGAAFDGEWRIVSAEHSGRRVSRLEHDGTVTALAETWHGHRLGRPNDVVVRSDGNIYFTAPWWDLGAGGECDAPSTWYHLDADGQVHAGPDDYEIPNGLMFAPDEQVLYVNDSSQRLIRAYDVARDGRVDVSSDRVFFRFTGDAPGSPDGMKVDLRGNVYCGGPGGLWVISPEGVHLGTVQHGAAQVNNLAFGGDGMTTLFLCSWTTLFRVELEVAGAHVRPSTPSRAGVGRHAG